VARSKINTKKGKEGRRQGVAEVWSGASRNRERKGKKFSWGLVPNKDKRKVKASIKGEKGGGRKDGRDQNTQGGKMDRKGKTGFCEKTSEKKNFDSPRATSGRKK